MGGGLKRKGYIYHWYDLFQYSIEIKFGLVIGLKELPKILFHFSLFHISYFKLESVNILT